LNEKQKYTENLHSIIEKIQSYLSAKDTARENTLRICRDIIRLSANAIRAIHRRDESNAEKLLDSASALLFKLNWETSEAHSDLLQTGFVHDAQKELAEAKITFAIVTAKPLPDPDQIEVSYAAYLNGLGEAVGEIRRYILDSLRKNEYTRCEELLSIMDDFYAVLVSVDFPDAITHGLRRTADNTRGILEKTRGDLTLILKQKELEQKINPVVDSTDTL